MVSRGGGPSCLSSPDLFHQDDQQHQRENRVHDDLADLAFRAGPSADPRALRILPARTDGIEVRRHDSRACGAADDSRRSSEGDPSRPGGRVTSATRSSNSVGCAAEMVTRACCRVRSGAPGTELSVAACCRCRWPRLARWCRVNRGWFGRCGARACRGERRGRRGGRDSFERTPAACASGAPGRRPARRRVSRLVHSRRRGGSRLRSRRQAANRHGAQRSGRRRPGPCRGTIPTIVCVKR
jgi:hypothetical protein